MSTTAAIEIEQTYACNVHVIWKALTDPTSLASWWPPNDVKADVGHPV